MPSKPDPDYLHDFLAERFPNTDAVRTFVGVPPIRLSEADFSIKGSARDLWHHLLKMAGEKGVFEPLVAETIRRFPQNEAFIRRAADDWAQGLVPEPARIDPSNPYPGLKPFERGDRANFFGRESWVREILAEVRRPETRIFTLYGGSGSGKSSLFRAGIEPEWESAKGKSLLLTPGSDPFTSLLVMALGNRFTEKEAFLDEARAGRRDDLLKKLQAEHYPDRQVLLIVDQGEQLFTRTRDPALRECFLRCLFTDGGPMVRVLFGIRDDYFPVWSQTLPRASSRATALRPPTEEEYRAIIVRPARRHGVLFQDGLSRAMLDAVKDQRGALPLLQFVLERLWEKGEPETGTLSHDVYTNLGGVEGALRQHIQDFLEKFPGRDAEIKQLLLSLVRFEARENKYFVVSKACPADDLPDDLREALLSDNWRLLTTSRQPDNVASPREAVPRPGLVEFSHEAVLLNWPGFDTLTQQHGETLARHGEVVEDSGRYRRAAPADKARLLWTGARLDTALLLAGLGPHAKNEKEPFSLADCALTAEQRDFLLAGWRWQRFERWTKRFSVLALVFVTLAACGLALWARHSQQLAQWGLGEVKVAYQAVESEKNHAQEQLLLSTRKAWGAARQALDAESPDLATGLARLAEAVRYNDTLPEPLRLPSLDTDAAQTLLRLPNLGQPAALPLRHDAGVNAAAFSPDGNRVVTASDDGTARVWDAATGNPLTEPMQHGMPVLRAVFSPDGTQVLTVSEGRLDENGRRTIFRADGQFTGGEARLWDAATGKGRHQPWRTGRGFASANFSPDGKWVVAVAKGGTFTSWNTATGEETPPAHPVGGNLRWAGFSPDGRSLGLVNSSGRVFVMDWPDGVLQSKGRPADPYAELSPRNDDDDPTGDFSPDGKRVLVKNLNFTAWIAELETEPMPNLSLDHTGPINSARFSPDGRWVVTASDDGTAQVWNANASTRVGKWMSHQAAVNTAVFSPDGRRVVTASTDGTARVWSAATGEPAGAPMHHAGQVECAEFSPDGRRVVTASRDGTAQVWETSSGAAGGTPFWLGGWIVDATFDRRGDRLLTAGYGHHAQVWDAATAGAVGAPLEHRATIRQANFSPDGAMVVTASEDGTAQVWDAATGGRIGGPILLDGIGRTAAFSPDGMKVVIGTGVPGGRDNGMARMWTARAGAPVGQPMSHFGPVLQTTFSPDGKMIVTLALGGLMRIWDAATGEPRDDLHLSLWPEMIVHDARFSPDSRALLLQDERRVSILDASNGRWIGRHRSSDTDIMSACFSPDGTEVATSDAGGVAQRWSTFTGEKRGVALIHPAPVVPVERVEYSPDGRWLVTVSGGGKGGGDTVRIWDPDKGRVVGLPLRCEESVNCAHFSPDGRWVLTSGSWDAARLWEVGLAVRGPDFSKALEAFAGERVGVDGRIEVVPVAERMAARAALPPEDGGDFARLLRWRFAQATSRRLSPHSPLTVPQYIEREIDGAMNHSPRAAENDQEAAQRTSEKNRAILENAYALDPGHPLIHFALAAFERDPYAAGFDKDFGLKHLPADPRVCAAAMQILLRQGDLPRAKIAAGKVLALDPQNADASKVQAQTEK